MIFDWWKSRRRRKLWQQPFPDDWELILRQNVLRFESLTPTEQERVRKYIQVFVAEKHWEGCRGVKMTDEIRVTIAALVAIMMLGFDGQYFDRVLSILVNPHVFASPNKSVNEAGVVIEQSNDRIGEAWYRGPVILSWAEVLAAGCLESGGRNVVCHEFAHQLDMLNGSRVDGIPPLESDAQLRRWEEVMTQNYGQLVDACEQGRDTLIDCYGATDRSEFFAVATETFFEEGEYLRYHHADLYAILSEFYRQDPASRAMLGR